MTHSYLPHTDEERRLMLAEIGVASQEDLLTPVPSQIRLRKPPDLPPAQTEAELRRTFLTLAGRNTDPSACPCFLGAGAYLHHIPAAVDHLAGRAEFYTAYTPYQPEMSQGMLQSIFEFQTMIAELCGLSVANASLYDGATAVAEAALMALGATNRRKLLIARTLHPDYYATLQTYLRHRGLELVELAVGQGSLRPDGIAFDQETAGLIVAYPNFLGQIEDLAALAQAAHAAGALLVVAANPIALGLLEAPGILGADIVVGEGQPLGSPPSFGGPGLGFMACREEYLRRMPGRLVGQTTDGVGRRGFVLTLQTREQHIRREKATSNICSNAALMALRASIYLSLLGPVGLRSTAEQCASAARYALERLTAGGGYSPVFSGPFFHEFVLGCPVPPAVINAELLRQGIIGGLDLEPLYPELGPSLLLCLTELRTAAEIDKLAAVMGAFV